MLSTRLADMDEKIAQLKDRVAAEKRLIKELVDGNAEQERAVQQSADQLADCSKARAQVRIVFACHVSTPCMICK